MKKQTLDNVAFDSNAYIIEKKSQAKMEAELAFHEARLKSQSLQFKPDSHTLV